MKSKTGISGFTIIELMIAISIFGFFITIIYSSFSTITKSSSILRDRTDLFNNASNALRIIENDLRSIHILKIPEYKKPDFNGVEDPFSLSSEIEFVEGKEFSKISFSSLNHISTGKKKIKKITRIDYFVKFEKDKGFVLKRRDNPNFSNEDLSMETPSYSLLEGIEAFSITFDGNRQNTQTAWNSQSSEYGYSTPEKIVIRISVVLNGEKQTIKSTVRLLNFRESLI